MKKYTISLFILSALLTATSYADSTVDQTDSSAKKSGFVAGNLGTIQGSKSLVTDSAQPIVGANVQFLRNFQHTGFMQAFGEFTISDSKVKATDNTQFPFQPGESIDLISLGANTGLCLFAQSSVRLCPLVGMGTLNLHGSQSDGEFYGYSQIGLRVEIQIPQLSDNLLIMPELDSRTISQTISGKTSTENMQIRTLGIGWKL